MPDELDRDGEILEKIAAIRAQASVAMGIARSLEEGRAKTHIPFVGIVSAAQDARTLSGGRLSAAEVDLTVRFVANGHIANAIPGTASLCTAVAAGIEGTTVFQAARRVTGASLRLRNPPGKRPVGPAVGGGEGV